MPKIKKIKKKLPWVPMHIYRVLLSPEQAVLSCCSTMSRALIAAPYQCKAAGCDFSPEFQST